MRRIIILVVSLVSAFAFIAGPGFAASSHPDKHQDAGEESQALTEAIEWFSSQRLAPNEAVNPNAYAAAAAAAADLPTVSGTWTERTSTPGTDGNDFSDSPAYVDPTSNFSNSGAGDRWVAGRMTSLAAAPGGTLFAGAADGGVWKSTDGGQQWTPTTDDQATLSIGALLVSAPQVAGVVFTGSTEVARIINRTLAAKDGPIATLIAETGGINAMIADATALPEQVCDDVIASAFRSAGQRCSALRLLCVQGDVADRVLEMVVGAARELKLGDPRDPATHVGPVIDRDAKDKLERWIAEMEARGAVRFRLDKVPRRGTYVAPTIVDLDRARDLNEEIFGPVLHVVRFSGSDLDQVLDDLAGNGTALTLGIHSRIDAAVTRIAARMPHGNVYVNRNMIGAVVGSQPFGGSGLSGTGPKAGGPDYLRRLALEQVVSVNTAAAGGDPTLLSEEDG